VADNGTEDFRVPIATISLGCPKNTVDTEAMLGSLDPEKFRFAQSLEDARVVVINTCAFTEQAVEESVEAIVEIAENKQELGIERLIVVGCLPERFREGMLDELPEVDAILGTGEIMRLNEFVLEGFKKTIDAAPDFLYDHTMKRLRVGPVHTSYIKIAEGCDHSCAFCVIPALKGAFRSRTVASVLDEARGQIAEGARELVLIAQDSTTYGRDLEPKDDLGSLLRGLNGLEGDFRVRVMYLHPSALKKELIEAFSLPKIAPYFDLPLQHASRSMLTAMHREGDGEQYLAQLMELRRMHPEAAIRSAFIVGFPGETEEDIDALAEFLKAARLDRVGFFTYSDLEEVKSHTLPGHIDEEEKERRLEYLASIQAGVSHDAGKIWVGRRLNVLVEFTDEEEGVSLGRSHREAPEVDGLTIVEGIFPIGEFVEVEVTEAGEHDLAAVPLVRSVDKAGVRR